MKCSIVVSVNFFYVLLLDESETRAHTAHQVKYHQILSNGRSRNIVLGFFHPAIYYIE